VVVAFVVLAAAEVVDPNPENLAGVGLGNGFDGGGELGGELGVTAEGAEGAEFAPAGFPELAPVEFPEFTRSFVVDTMRDFVTSMISSPEYSFPDSKFSRNFL
jgi:hypothetical protein